MLDSRFRFDLPGYDPRRHYNLTMARDAHKARKQVLIILQSVDSRDIQENMLLSPEVKPALVNSLKYTRAHTRRVDPDVDMDVSYTVINFNAYRHLHMSPERQQVAEKEFADRVHKAIEKLKPTHVFVSGDRAFSAMFPKIKHVRHKRGWVHKMELAGRETLVTGSICFSRLLEKQGANANLLGFWCRHLSNLLVGRNPYDISDIKPKPVYVDTMEKFRKLMGLFRQTKRVAIDTETRNLSVNFNRIYIMQFCFEERQDRGYVLPISHPMSPFTKEEQAEIRRTLRAAFKGSRKFWRKPYVQAVNSKENALKLHPKHRLFTECSADELPELVFFNGMYDLRVLRTDLAIEYIPHFVYECMAGEHNLDENYTELKIFGARHGGLDAVACSYGNDFYKTAKFGKNERATAGSVAPSNPEMLDYCSMDVQLLMGVRKCQILRASHELYNGQNYKPRFLRHLRYMMSDTAHQLSRLREDGSFVDMEYLRHLLSLDSPLRKDMIELYNRFMAFKSVQKVGTQILSDVGFKAKSVRDLLLKKKSQTTTRTGFKLGKPAHRAMLFFDELGLPAVSQTPKGEPAIDKEFIAAHRMRSEEVDVYGDFQEVYKLYTAYIRGWVKRIRSTKDGMSDFHLRPDYGFAGVQTGRLASYNPSLQVIPTRSKPAKMIKRAFVAPPGYLLIRFDYSAHEVRMWAVVADDMKLADQFRKGQKLRQAYIMDPSEENALAIKMHGDLHILNVKRFFNRVVDKNHPLRDAVKAVIFGAIYGKSAATLGEDTKLPDIKALEKEIAALRGEKVVDLKKINELNAKIKAIREEDRTEFAQDILNRLFQEFAKGSAWLSRMKKSAQDQQQVYSPLGRIRHLFATMTEDQAIVARQLRRGVNAPIQGIASELGTKASRLIEQSYHYELPVFCDMLGLDESDVLPLKFNRLVHDASYFAVPYEMVLPFMHILQKEATYGITDATRRDFGINFNIEPEIEIEFVGRDDISHKWAWKLDEVPSQIRAALTDLQDLNKLPEGQSVDSIMATIMKPWQMPKMRSYLDKRYPLLGVSLGDKLEKVAA